MSGPEPRAAASSFFLDKRVTVKQTLFGGAEVQRTSEEIKEDQQLLLRWVAVIRTMLAKSLVTDRSIKGVLFKRVFSTSDFVSELLKQLGPSGTRGRAVKVAQRMERRNLLRHYANNSRAFKDSANEYYVPTLFGWRTKNNMVSGEDTRLVDQPSSNAQSRDELLRSILAAMILSPDVMRSADREFYGVECIDYITSSTDITERKHACALATELLTMGYVVQKVTSGVKSQAKKKRFQDNLTRYKAMSSGGTMADYDVVEPLHQNVVVTKMRHRITGSLHAMMEFPERLKDPVHISVQCFQSVLSPYIVRVEDVIMHNNIVNVPCQFAGEPVFDAIRRASGYTEAIVAKVCRSILLALRDFHTRNVIYRGLSLGKVLVSPPGTLLDAPGAAIRLGFALSTSVTSEGQVGDLAEGISPIYAAPEMFSKDSTTISCSPATDVWSFGVLLHMLLTAEFPFARVGGLLELDPSSEVYSHLSPGAVQLLMSVLNLHADARPSVKQLLSHPWISGQNVSQSSLASVRTKLMFKFCSQVVSAVSSSSSSQAEAPAQSQMSPATKRKTAGLFSKPILTTSSRRLLDRGETGILKQSSSKKAAAAAAAHSEQQAVHVRAVMIGEKQHGKRTVCRALGIDVNRGEGGGRGGGVEGGGVEGGGVEEGGVEMVPLDGSSGAWRTTAPVQLQPGLTLEFVMVTPDYVLADGELGYHPFLLDLDVVIYVQSIYDAVNADSNGYYKSLYDHKCLQQFKGLDEGVPFIVVFTHLDKMKAEWRQSGSMTGRSMMQDLTAKFVNPPYARKNARNTNSIMLPFSQGMGPPDDFLAPRIAELIQQTRSRQFRLDVKVRAERAVQQFSLFNDKRRGVTTGKIGRRQLEAIQAMAQRGSVTSLHLSGLKHSNVLSSALSVGSGLDRIVLNKTVLSVKTASVASGANPMRVLVLNNIKFERGAFPFIGRIVRKSPYLELLDVSHCSLGRLEWYHLGRSLWNTRSLRILYAVDSGLGSSAIRELIPVFYANDSVERLHVEANEHISRNDIILFAAGIERSFVSKLQQLGCQFELLDANLRAQLGILFLAKKQRVLRGLRSDLKKAHLKRIQQVEKSTIGSLDLSMCDLTYMGFHKSFSSLESLNLSSNQLTRVPSLGNLGMLKELVLRGNSLVDVPPGIETLQKLEHLDISMNRIEVVDKSIGQLVSLTSFDARWNRIKSPPPTMYQLTRLQRLLMSHNRVHQINPKLFELPNLKICDFTVNEIDLATSEILLAWGHHSNSLSLQHLELVFMPVELGHLTYQYGSFGRWGSRTPLRDTPVWATLEVLKGGFASGKVLSESPMEPWELQLCKQHRLDATQGRAQLNQFFSANPAGKQLMHDALYSGAYHVELAEHAALLVAACMRDQDDAQACQRVLSVVRPFFDTMRFYPELLARPVVEHQRGHLFVRSVTRVIGDLTHVHDSLSRGQMLETVTVWEPLFCHVVALWKTTVDEQTGWPCQHYADDFGVQAAALLQRYASLRRVHQLVAKVDKRRSHFWVLRSMLARWQQLTARDVGYVRKIIECFDRKRGATAHEQEEYHRKQLAAATSKTSSDFAREVIALLGPFASDYNGLPRNTLSQLDQLPASVARKVWRCIVATPEELIEHRVIASGELLAKICPDLVSASIVSDDSSPPVVVRLFRRLYSSFRRRRGLLLTHLQRQVQLEEIPWAVELGKHCDAAQSHAKRSALRQLVKLHVHHFPQTPFSNTFLRELREISDQPLVENLAADIFQGQLTAKFLHSAQIAGRVLQESLYARYYSIDYARIADWQPEEELCGYDGYGGERILMTTPELLALCEERADVANNNAEGNKQASYVTRNGMVVEQQQILCGAHNLATFADVVRELDPFQLAERTLKSIKRLFDRMPKLRTYRSRWGRSRDNWVRRMQAVKRAAFAWRQLVFFLSFVDAGAAVQALQRHQDGLPEKLIGGLLQALRGQTPTHVFLGWSTNGHWLLKECFQDDDDGGDRGWDCAGLDSKK